MHLQPNKITLVDFESEVEQRESDGIRCVLQRYAPLFKFLFERYTLYRMGAHNSAALISKNASTLEHLGNKTIKTEELRKMLKIKLKRKSKLKNQNQRML